MVKEEKTGMRILIPILSKQESNAEFLEKIPNAAEEIFLLLVIDKGFMHGQFGFAASDIAAGNVLMQMLRKYFVKRRKKCFDIEEWGATENKIIQMAQLKLIDKIFLVKQNNLFYDELVEQLREKSGSEIVEIGLPKPLKK
ncbi:MAG: hypothetical protein PHH08_03455 [Candidatus ainarchaeum sp.]|nr:hypothetical protein [Candidatus ainarchaeum sp.]